MSWSYNIGFGTGTYWRYQPAPPPPPKPVEIVFEHERRRHRLLVTEEMLAEFLQKSALYEQHLERQKPQRLSTKDAELQIRVLSQTGSDVPLKTAIRRAKRIHHPDTGGTANGFRTVIDAERILIEAGLL